MEEKVTTHSQTVRVRWQKHRRNNELRHQIRGNSMWFKTDTINNIERTSACETHLMSKCFEI